MKLKIILGLILAISTGLGFGFLLKSGTEIAKGFLDNKFTEFFVENTNKLMGGPGPEGINSSAGGSDLYENFPNNSLDNVLGEDINQNDFSINKEGKTIVADLEQMRIQTYLDGNLVDDFEILGKGRQGTAWETPPGKYSILYKTENHFSSIGKVWMPFSMQFFGNYFIHGWPYYSDGTPVAPGYSGGCIRVGNGDMQKIYEFSDADTDVVVRGSLPEDQKDFKDGKYELFDKNKKFPNISADAYLVADLENGVVIDSYAQKAVYPIASLTKLMTALVSLETVNQYSNTNVSYKAFSTYGAQGNLQVGENYSIGDLIYPLLLESSNDASEVIAEFAGRNYFISNMNKKAKSIGLENTVFGDPSGLSEENKSTAEELFKLTQYIYKYKNYILDITKNKTFSLNNKIWNSNSRFKNDTNYIGGKNGYTDEAKYTIISLFDLPLQEFEDRKIAIVLLQSENIEKDVRDIVLWLLSNVYFVEGVK